MDRRANDWMEGRMERRKENEWFNGWLETVQMNEQVGEFLDVWTAALHGKNKDG